MEIKKSIAEILPVELEPGAAAKGLFPILNGNDE